MACEYNKPNHNSVLHALNFVVSISVKFYCFTSPFVPNLEAQISGYRVDHQGQWALLMGLIPSWLNHVGVLIHFWYCHKDSMTLTEHVERPIYPGIFFFIWGMLLVASLIHVDIVYILAAVLSKHFSTNAPNTHHFMTNIVKQYITLQTSQPFSNTTDDLHSVVTYCQYYIYHQGRF